jgi:hypothetical protein
LWRRSTKFIFRPDSLATDSFQRTRLCLQLGVPMVEGPEKYHAPRKYTNTVGMSRPFSLLTTPLLIPGALVAFAAVGLYLYPPSRKSQDILRPKA